MQHNRKFISNLQEQIQTRMDYEKLSIRELERKSGLNVGAVQNIINGRSTNPGIEFIAAIAKALNCGVDELLGDSNAYHKTSNSMPSNQSNNKSVSWNANLYKDATTKVEDYLKDKNVRADSDAILELIRDVYLYAIECHETQADMRFIKWLVDKNFK